MARPMETALSYFPLDCDFFTNKKVKALKRKHGTVGLVAYLDILCKVYANGYYYKFGDSKDDIEQLAYDIAEEIANTSLAKVASRVIESINYMADNNLLDMQSLGIGVLTSLKIQEQYILTTSRFRHKAQLKEYSLIPVSTVAEKQNENGVNAQKPQVNAQKPPINVNLSHERESERKEKDINKKINIEQQQADGFFIVTSSDDISGISDGYKAEVIWQSVSDVLRRELSSLIYEVWIEPLRPIGMQDDTLILLAPTTAFADEVNKKYASVITQAIKETDND